MFMQLICSGGLVLSIILTFVSLIAASPAGAQTSIQSLGGYSSDQVPGKADLKKSFVTPNERDPQLAQEIWDASPGGLYLSVGTERGFIGASLANNTTHLLLVDVDPKVMIYDRTNIALLKLSTDRKDYLHLRFEASPKEWQARIAKNTSLNIEERAVLSLAENHSFWQKAVSFKSLFMHASALPQKDHGKDFRNANYLVYDDQFQRLKTMADDGRIRYLSLNLNDQAQVTSLVEKLKALKIKIGVLDVSNAWWGIYVGEDGINHLIRKFAEIAFSDSLVMITEKAPVKGSSRWDYFAFKIRELTSHNAPQVFRTAGSKDSGIVAGRVHSLGGAAGLRCEWMFQ
jgi:hypothetical protein